MLHFPGGIALGVDVGDLLQLESAFERDRVVDAAAEEQRVLDVMEAAGERFIDSVVGEHRLELPGETQQLLHEAAGGAFVEPTVSPGRGASRG